MSANEIEETTEPKETFLELCQELGKRISSTENALLCYRAYRAYLREHPNTAHGKARAKLGREPSFRKAASKASGVAPATIDALLQVGKAIDPLSKEVKAALANSSLSRSMRVLRKLATKEHNGDRAELITEFAKQEQTNPKSAKTSLKNKLGMAGGVKESVEARVVAKPESHFILPGEHLDLKVGRYLVRVEVGEMDGERIHLTAMAGTGEEAKVAKLLESEATKAHPKKLGSKSSKPGKGNAALAA